MARSFRLVPPRVRSSSGEKLLLTDLIQSIWVKNRALRLHLRGHGVSCALDYLSDWFGDSCRKDSTRGSLVIELGESQVEITRDGSHADESALLTNWGLDEFIEYLLLNHHDQCKHVMARVDRSHTHFGLGAPEIWQPVLRAMAVDEHIENPIDAIFQLVGQALDQAAEPSSEWYLQRELIGAPWGAHVEDSGAFLARALENRDVLHLLQGNAIARDVAENRHRYLPNLTNANVIQATASFLQPSSKCVAFLERCLQQGLHQCQVTALLCAICENWKPPIIRKLQLKFGDFSDVDWAGADLDHLNAEEATFHGAILSYSDLKLLRAVKADFCDADLRHCELLKADFGEAYLVRANFDEAIAMAAEFVDADASDATMRRANLQRAVFRRTDLSRANLHAADCRHACFDQVVLQDTVLSACNFCEAQFFRCDLRKVEFDNSHFTRASLKYCLVEDVRLAGVCFSKSNLAHSMLTGSIAQNVSFQNACLRSAGLADVFWQGCDLREADLAGVSFHLGSTRCGLVGSPYPSHGTRTGFYTDDFENLSFEQPEAIRKAALIDCDLRGANLQEVDFYLVDLRGAKFDERHRLHLLRCGAILGE